MLLATTRENPRSRAGQHVHRVAGAGDRAGSERQRVGFFRMPRALVSRARSAATCARKKCATSTGCAGRKCVNAGISASPAPHLTAERSTTLAIRLQQRNAAPQIQPQVERHLLVARSARVQPAARVAEALDEQPFDEAVDVFVGTVDEGRFRSAPAPGSRQRRFDLARLVALENARPGERARPRDAARHVVFEEAPVEAERRAPFESGRHRALPQRSGLSVWTK